MVGGGWSRQSLVRGLAGRQLAVALGSRGLLTADRHLSAVGGPAILVEQVLPIPDFENVRTCKI